VIDLTGIYNALIEQWDKFPNVSRSQFTNGVESRGIATAVEADAYVGHFILAARSLAVLDGDDWDALQTRVQALGLEVAVRAGRKIHAEVLEYVDYKVERLQLQLDGANGLISEADRKLTNGAIGRDWIDANAPGGPQLRADMLDLLDVGIAAETGKRTALLRIKAELEERITKLGGTPT
jgi:hypothetical protein